MLRMDSRQISRKTPKIKTGNGLPKTQHTSAETTSLNFGKCLKVVCALLE